MPKQVNLPVILLAIFFLSLAFFEVLWNNFFWNCFRVMIFVIVAVKSCITVFHWNTFGITSFSRCRLVLRNSSYLFLFLMRNWNKNCENKKTTRTTGPRKVKIRELKQPRRRRQQKPRKFAYLTMKNSISARFARAFVVFWHFEDVLVLSTTWNDLFCSCEDDTSIWRQMFNFVFLCPKRWFQFNSRIVRTHFSSIMTLSNWKMIAEPRSYIFRWRSRFPRRRVCLSSLILRTPQRRDRRVWVFALI